MLTCLFYRGAVSLATWRRLPSLCTPKAFGAGRGFPNPLAPRRIRHPADLAVGDTAGLEACATSASHVCIEVGMKISGLKAESSLVVHDVVRKLNRAGRSMGSPLISIRQCLFHWLIRQRVAVAALLPAVSQFCCAHHRQSPTRSMPCSHRWAVAGKSELASKIVPPRCRASTKSKSAGRFCIRPADAVFRVIF